MADVTPPTANGNGGVKRDLAVARLLGAIVFALAGVTVASFFVQAVQWDLTVKVVDGLLILANTLAGGLLVKTRST